MRAPFYSDWHFEGWHYANEDDDYGEGKIKTSHYAVKDTALGQERRDLDHSPYEDVSKEAFAAYAALGFPSRPESSSVAWKNATIIEAFWNHTYDLSRVPNTHARDEINRLDATMFSGDAFFDDNAREVMKAYLGRWSRRLGLIDLMESDET